MRYVLAILLAFSLASCAHPTASLKPANLRIRITHTSMSNASWGGFGSGNFVNSSQLAGGAGGRVFLDGIVTDRMLQAGSITAVSYRCVTAGTTNGMQFVVYRVNGSNYDFVGASEAFTPITGSNQTRTLTTPITGVRVGDVCGVWVDIDGGGAAFTDISVAASSGNNIPWVAGSPGGTNVNFPNTVANFALDLEFFGAQPTAAMTGDSIEVGHGGTFTSYFDGTGPAVGSDGAPLCELGYNMKPLIGGSWNYQDFANGSQTLAWVLSTGVPAILSGTGMHGSVACGATELWIHCVVNDIAGGRSNAAIQADLDSIRTLWGTVNPIFIDEVLPDSNFNDTQAAAVRSWNTALASWASGKSNVRVVSCWSAFGQNRTSTGQNDDLLSAYNSGDGVHLNAAGAAALALLRKNVRLVATPPYNPAKYSDGPADAVYSAGPAEPVYGSAE